MQVEVEMKRSWDSSFLLPHHQQPELPTPLGNEAVEKGTDRENRRMQAEAHKSRCQGVRRKSEGEAEQGEASETRERGRGWPSPVSGLAQVLGPGLALVFP